MKKKLCIVCGLFLISFILMIVSVYMYSLCAKEVNRNYNFYMAEVTVDRNILEKGYKTALTKQQIDYKDLNTIPWNIKDPLVRGDSAKIQMLTFIDPLLATYSATREEKYIIAARDICLEWIKIHQAGNNDLSIFTWWEMIDGLRAAKLAYVYKTCKDLNLLTDSEDKIFRESLSVHAKHLMEDKNINFNNNHGFFQIAGQLYFSKLLIGVDPIYKKSYNQAQTRLERILPKQIFIHDGVHKENSPGYNWHCYKLIKGLYDSDCLSLRQRLLVNKMGKNLYWFFTPDFHLANLGDSDYQSFADVPEIKNLKINHRKKYISFKESGYFAVKGSQNYLIQHSGFSSRTHRHCDDLSFILYDFNQPILMESGAQPYSGKTAPDSELFKNGFYYTNPNRIFIETTRAHNTLEFNNGNNPRKNKDMYGNAIKKSGYCKRGGYYYVTSKINMRGKIFERTLYYTPEKYLVVHDKFNSTKENLTTVKQWFHLAPDLTMTKDGEKYVINLKNGNKITVSQLSKDAKADRLYRGEREPRMQGWFSDNGKLVENYAFNYEIKNQNSGEFITVFEINGHYPSQLINKKLKQINDIKNKQVQYESDILDKGCQLGQYHIDYNNIKGICWNIKDDFMRSYNADIQKLLFLKPLLDAYNVSHDTKYLIPAKNICLEWIKIHQKGSKDLSEFTWWEMIDGVRADIMSNVFAKCLKNKLLTNDEKEIFIKSLLEHAEYIMDDKNINFRNNHGFFQIACQLRFSKTMMPYNPVFKKSYKQARKRLDKILAMQFFMKDGIHKENSPGYNYLCKKTLKMLDGEGHLTYRQKILTNKLKSNIWWFTLPNFHIPNLGDTDYSMITEDVDLPKRGKKYHTFKEAGYFAVKDNQSYLLHHAGFASATHRHCDDLNFVLYDLGQNILMDAGKYAYSGGHFPKNHPLAAQGFWYTNPNRIYIETTRAHNTLEFNDGNNPRKKKDFYKNAIKRSGYDKKGNYYYVTSKINIRGKIFERTLYYSPEKYLVVRDKFNSTKEDLKTVKQWFHLAPDLTMKKDGEKYVINLKNNNKITVSQLSKEVKADKLYKGEKEPRMQGWISMEYDTIEPNYAFNYEIKNNKKGEFITIFVINDNKVPEDIKRKL